MWLHIDAIMTNTNVSVTETNLSAMFWHPAVRETPLFK